MKNGSIPQEVELKLELEPDMLDQVLADPLFQTESHDSPVTQNLHSTYFDTPDQALRQAGISFRIRRNGDQNIQTIKASRPLDGIALSRSEWEHEIEGEDPDYTAAEETALKPFLKVRETIQPVFRMTAQRKLRRLSYGSSIIEVAVDRGEIVGREQTFTFGELELELKEGTPADLFGLAQELSAKVPLRLSFKTKAERGYEAISDEAIKRVKAGPVVLRRRMTSAQAFQIISASCLRHLMVNDAIVRTAPEADAVHQMRVALRRLRAAITLFKDVVEDDRRDQIKAELKWMANLLGEARDLDVYIAKVLEPARAQNEHNERYRQLLADYEEQRQQAYQAVQDTIASPRFINGILETAAWIQAGDWVLDDSKIARRRQERPVAELAEEEIGRRWKRVLKRGRHLADLDPEERHQVRIEIKKLRYATEFFDSLFKGGGAKRRKRDALSTLEALQETLGELNDIAVGSEMNTSSAADAIHQDQISRVGDLIAAAEEQHRKLASLEPFWKT
ncbi:CYTH and CHAD domain-containing protein [Microvirga makkahensis]|uniref:CHAD domain-containing protein n=1 Tax=Microvirga makkahensis TaxID=1128670 RepID=A0A7X3SML7_9HYPH|nr:CYTH and CHAD domain-containing protein [Microvirga makkahensis]MXQ10263.1 CHAD domain-containing protein [Microvirga makkahensis]